MTSDLCLHFSLKQNVKDCIFIYIMLRIFFLNLVTFYKELDEAQIVTPSPSQQGFVGSPQ